MKYNADYLKVFVCSFEVEEHGFQVINIFSKATDTWFFHESHSTLLGSNLQLLSEVPGKKYKAKFTTT